MTSPDIDPDLIVVRERYDSESRIQSIYFRFADGTSDREILSGTIAVTGASVIGLIHDPQTLKESDSVWGIPGVSYGLGRGLEGNDVAQTEPDVASDDDLLIHTGNEVRFWLSTKADIDEFRVLVGYPSEHQAASVSVIFWHLRGRDIEGYPVTTPGQNGATGGIVVGSITDHTPDDGDYGEILSIGKIRLKTEDLDLQEDELELGTVNHTGGVLGPATFHIDNFLNDIDYDNDNPPDQNGVFAPVPNQGDLTQLKAAISPLQNEQGALISPNQIQILGIPTIVVNGTLEQSLVSVNVSPNTPIGHYRGFLTVWEDNNLSGVPDEDEPQDTLVVSVNVEPSPRIDQGILRDVGVFADAGGQLDATANADRGFDMHVQADLSGVDIDILDGLVDVDAASDLDVLADMGLTTDSVVALDTERETDSTRMNDTDNGMVDMRAAQSDLSITETWRGKARGGSIQCGQTAPNHHWLLTILFLIGLRSRR